jgi:4-aminobutyrate aminotransferase
MSSSPPTQCRNMIKVEADSIAGSDRSRELITSLNQLRSRADIGPHILDVRGLGLMIAVEFASPSPVSTYDPNTLAGAPKNLASRVAKRCLENGMLILTTSVYEVVRFIPPLNVSAEEMARGIEIFTRAVEEVVKEG